jgi:hypothetical protein
VPTCGGDIRLIAFKLFYQRETGASSCRSMTIATSLKRRIDELPVIDIHSL